MTVLPLTFLLLILSEAERLEGKFARHFPECVNASQVRVSCKEKNDTGLIRVAQYCAPDHQSCPNSSKSGVSLEKTGDEVSLTVTTSAYCSWLCEADCYIDDDKRPFTINVCNQTARTLLSPGPTSALPRTVHMTRQVSTETSPDPGNNVKVILIASIVLFILITFLILYMKVEYFRNAIRGLKSMRETPENEKFLKSESVV